MGGSDETIKHLVPNITAQSSHKVTETDRPSQPVAVHISLCDGQSSPLAERWRTRTLSSATPLPHHPDPGVFAVVLETTIVGERTEALIAQAAVAYPAARLIVVIDDGGLDRSCCRLLESGALHTLLPRSHRQSDLPGLLNRLCIMWTLERLSGEAAGGTPRRGDAATDEPAMVGGSRAMRRVFATIRKFATTGAPVLITGESGTGKELAALAIHERSSASDGPFVAINCGGIPHDLIQAELFGYEKGAFTGATGRKLGRFEKARGGTLFLDEIGDMPLALQAHLLRFLQEGTIERLGGLESLTINTRIIAGTNVDLEKAVREQRFRQDLFFRLNVLRLELPPLRERDDDILVLAQFFLERLRQEHGKPRAELTPEARVALRNHTWPGNVRELISTVRRGLTMCSRGRITAQDLGLYGRSAPLDAPERLADARARAECDAVLRALQHADNKIGKAASVLGVSRVTLYNLLKKHDLSKRFDGRHKKGHDGGAHETEV